MSNLKKALPIVLIFLIISLALPGINILQNGLGGWDGRSMDAILGIRAEKATLETIEALSKSDVMQLFYAAEPPVLNAMKGEYRAKLLSVGVLAFATELYTHHLFGPGRWEGKAFLPKNEKKGSGYNLFRNTDAADDTVARTRQMDTYIGPSNIDDKKSLHLDYAPYNSGMVHTMHDEIRKINDTLYIGMGYMAAGGGSINPAPFVVYGKPMPWKGMDK
jgi:hypothetical protein